LRKRNLLVPAVAVAAVLAALSVGSALAESFVAPTKPSLHVDPKTPVDVGTKVTFSGKLRSDRPFCRNDSEVTLRRYGDDDTLGGRVETVTTSKGGGYEFTVTVDEQGRYRVWFRGKVGGVHPDIKTCQKSRSKTITVFVA
jgi:hypothetical protein